MKRYLRMHSIKIRRTIFIIFSLFLVAVITAGLYIRTKSDSSSFVNNLFYRVADAICRHIYKEESSVFAYAESDKPEFELIAAVIESIQNGGSDILYVDKVGNSETIFDIYEDDSTNISESDLESLAIDENNHAAETETNNFQDEEGVLVVDKLQGMQGNKFDEPKTMPGGEGDAWDAAVPAVSLSNLLKTEYSMEKMKNLNYLLANYYIVDISTKATASLFQAETLLTKDMTIQKSNENIQILIYHTHASETYVDSRPGVWEDTVVGPGERLAEILRKKGYQVYHDKTAYDRKDGMDNRNYAYSTAMPHIQKFLKENPSVEVVIDLHRDSGGKRMVELNGKPAAQMMFFNGLSRNANGPITDLENPNLIDNLAFSLQANLLGRSMFPGLMYKIYLKNYRYNMHLAGRSMLIELGTQNNTVEEAYNTMEPLADILDQVLTVR